MVSFRSVVAAIALTVPVMAQTTPAQVVDNIRMLTQKSQALQAPAQSINIINGPLILIGQGPFPQIIVGFTDIVTTTTTALAQMNGMAPVPAGAQSDAIFDAFREFVRVHQVLLNILIGKAGLFSTVPFIGQPIAAVLRQIENVVDVRLSLRKHCQLPWILMRSIDCRFRTYRLCAEQGYGSSESSFLSWWHTKYCD